MLAEAGANPVNTASSTFQTTNAPSITTPLAGEYDITAESNASNGVSESNSMRVGVFVNAVEKETSVVSNSSGAEAIFFKLRATATKGVAVQARYKSDSAKSSNFYFLAVQIDPVRVG
jgi:hypothetical protein